MRQRRVCGSFSLFPRSPDNVCVETQGENPALQVGAELALYIPRKLSLGRARTFDEGLEMLRHHDAGDVVAETRGGAAQAAAVML